MMIRFLRFLPLLALFLMPSVSFANDYQCTLMTGLVQTNQANVQLNITAPTVSGTSIVFQGGSVKNIGTFPTSMSLRMRMTTTDVFNDMNSVAFHSDAFVGPNQTESFTNTITYQGLTVGQTYQFQIYDILSQNSCPPFAIQTVGQLENAWTQQEQLNITQGQGFLNQSSQLSAQIISEADAEAQTNNAQMPQGTTNDFDSWTQTPIGNGLGTSLNVTDPNGGQGLVRCGQGNSPMCGWDDLLGLIGRVVDFSLTLLVPLTAAIAVAAGINMIVSRGNPVKLDKAKAMLLRVVWALVLVLCAWILVAAVYSAFITDQNTLTQYVLLDIFQ